MKFCLLLSGMSGDMMEKKEDFRNAGGNKH